MHYPGFLQKENLNRNLKLLDSILFILFIAFLVLIIATSTKVNIAADSVDYYAMLQWVTPESEKPIVGNLHFAEQRSPGYSLLSLIPYSLLTVFVEPLVTTEKISSNVSPEYPNEIPGKTESQRKMAGSEMMFLPQQPLHIKDLFFKDYYVPGSHSWFQWKLALSLLITSYFFLFAGIWANVTALKLYAPSWQFRTLVPLVLVSSPVFIINIIELPLYATLTSYGQASLFALFVCISARSKNAWHIFSAGLMLGLLVLTRLELSIMAVLLIGYLIFTRNLRFLAFFSLGGSVAFFALVLYNLALFGVPLHFGILRGDINTFGFSIDYIFDNLLHPASGVLFFTPLLIPGLLFLVTGKNGLLKVLGFCSFILIIFYTLRIPIMYYHIGQGIIDIGGVPVTAPETLAQMRELIRSDINRYLSVFIPFSIIGFSTGIDRIFRILAQETAT
ncbi:MAG TPA: hypothetical protein HA257_07005 [Candidatus Methanoperedenaceae archaeon]|nr:hypothetical protein [Candidatus Methanoperedenaceae archaeon]